MRKTSIEEIAYYEAVNAVISIKLRRAFGKLSITSEGDSFFGRDLRNPASLLPEGELYNRKDKFVEDKIVMYFAWQIAEKRFSGKANKIRAQNYYHAALTILNTGCPGEYQYCLLDYLWCKAIYFVQRYWGYIDCLAQALLIHKELSRRQVTKVLLDAENERLNTREIQN
jgi:hypothetical protein